MKEVDLIVFGGQSVEHDISVITAVQTMRFLGASKFLPVYIAKNGVWWIAENLQDIKIYKNFSKQAKKRKQVSFVLGENTLCVQKGGKFVRRFRVGSVLNCCHGNFGEDGSLQGILKACEIPHSSCGVVSSAICMDKTYMKDILKANNVETAKYAYFRKCEFEKNKKLCKDLKFPVIVKPANLGSSIGISVCRNQDEYENALELAFQFDEKVLVELLVEKLREFNCACFYYKGKVFVSKPNEVESKSDLYTFDEKYLSEKTEPIEVDKKLTKKIQTMTEKVYKLFDCRGVVRVDFLFDEKEKKLYVNEINTIPGSLAFYLFKDIAFRDMIGSVLQQAKIDFSERNKLLTTFESDALKIFESVKAVSKK